MKEYEAGIIRTEFLGMKIYSITLSCPGIAGEVVPGQFVQVRSGSGTDPFLRRTFSVSGADRECGEIKLLIDVVGRGTELLCSMKRGESFNIIGSLGTGFDMNLGGHERCILVAGGTGAAPLIFLADMLGKNGGRDVTFMAGARTSKAIECFTSLFPKGIALETATDDGIHGFHGMVSELLERRIDNIKPAAIYTCGPHEMMKAVARIAEHYSIPCQISLEERMGCGIGACLGCSVLLQDGRMVRSCVDGPVFNASEVVL